MYLYRAYTDLELLETKDDDAAFPPADVWMNADADSLLELVHRVLPGWILHRCLRYAAEYRVLLENWHRLCAQWQTPPREILIVKFLPQDDWVPFSVLQNVCNALTKCGYVVRNATELVACEQCGDALLSHAVLAHVQTRYPDRFAHEWTPRCLACRALE